MMSLTIYNPTQLSDEDFIDGFVARSKIADNLILRLKEISQDPTAKHHLILGQRGMGKTSLLRRLSIEIGVDESLANCMIPLTFREEQYNVHSLAAFWYNCLDSLGDWYEKNGNAEKAENIDTVVAKLSQSDATTADTILEEFKKFSKQEKKRPVLFLDNVDIILEGIKGDEQWAFRRTLQRSNGIIIIGASTVYMEAFSDKDAAFYDFFQVTTLKKLSLNDLRMCLLRLSELRGESGCPVKKIVDEDPGRIQTLYDLTGGNPRTLVLLYLLLEKDSDGDVFNDLESLLDQVTSLYKARVEELSNHARVVIDAVALNWDPVIAADAGKKTGLTTSAVSTHLDRMHKEGIIEKVSVSYSKKTAFQISERFFNIWYLMRHAPRRQRTRLKWLTGFLRSFYSPEQLTVRAESVLNASSYSEASKRDYCLALSEAVDDPAWRDLLNRRALAEQPIDSDSNIEDIPSISPPASAVDWIKKANGFWIDSKAYDEAEDAFAKAYALDPENPFYWASLGGYFQYGRTDFAQSENAYQKSLQLKPDDGNTWRQLGNLYFYHLGKYTDAEQLYQRALEINPSDSWAWCVLGQLYMLEFNREKEALDCCKRSLEINPVNAIAWFTIANAESHSEENFEKIKTTLEKTIEIDPDWALPVSKLGRLYLYEIGDPEKAKLYIERAIELDGNDVRSLIDLAHLYQDEYKEYEAAEGCYLRALEIEPNNVPILSAISILYNRHLGRSNESQKFARKVTEIEPNSVSGWNLLASSYLDSNPDLSLKAYKKSIEIDPKQATILSIIASILNHTKGDYLQAEEYYLKSLEISKSVIALFNYACLLQDGLYNFEKAAIYYNYITDAEPQNAFEWGIQGYVNLFLFDDLYFARQQIKKALELEPDNISCRSNLLVLNILEGEEQISSPASEDILEKNNSSNADLIKAIAFINDGDFKKSCESFEKALKANDFSTLKIYKGFWIMYLKMVNQENLGKSFLKFMKSNGLDNHVWPVYAAAKALFLGEESLLDINPEVRSAARHIYEWMRYSKQKPKLDLGTGQIKTRKRKL